MTDIKAHHTNALHCLISHKSQNDTVLILDKQGLPGVNNYLFETKLQTAKWLAELTVLQT